MALSKKTIADLFFWVQIACAALFGVVQSHRMLSTAQGVSATWFSCWDIFLLINLVLAVKAHQVQPSRLTRQTVAVYAMWALCVTTAFVVQMFVGHTPWATVDTVTVSVAGVGIALTLLVGRAFDLRISDPMIRGCIALLFKAVPQLTMAWNIMNVGGEGVAGIMMISGNIAILTRLGQLWLSIKEAGWDRNRTGSFVSEVANELSWAACCAAAYFH